MNRSGHSASAALSPTRESRRLGGKGPGSNVGARRAGADPDEYPSSAPTARVKVDPALPPCGCGDSVAAPYRALGLCVYLVASAFDDNYLWPWACSAFSAIRTGGQNPKFLIANVDGLLSPRGEELALRTSEALGFSAEIVPLTTPTWDVHYANQWNATVFARLLLLDRLSERFLWLDSDTLVLNGWQQVAERSEDLFATSDVIACAVRDRDATLARMAKAGTNEAFVASRGEYVNAGVFVGDPQRWRAEGMHDRWMEVVVTQSRRGFEYNDQDVLNFVLAGRIGILPRAYNHIVSEPAMGDERVLHFAGYAKPWKLSGDAQAFFMASEALNAERPQHQISGGGVGWQLCPLYWQVEREFTARLAATGHEQLRDALLAIRAANVEALEWAASVKLRLMRLLAMKMRRRIRVISSAAGASSAPGSASARRT